MKHFLMQVMLMGLALPAFAGDNGIAQIQSKYSVLDTIKRLESVFKSHGLTVFAIIDFSGDAE